MWDDTLRIVEYTMEEAVNCVRSMDTTHRRICLLIAAGMILVILRGMRGELQRRMSLFWSVASGLFVGLLFVSIVIADVSGTLVFRPSDTPEHTVQHFFDSFLAGDMEAAVSDLTVSRQLFTAPEDVDDTAALYYKALKESYSYSLTGAARGEKTHMEQTVRFTSLKFSELPEPISAFVNEELKEVVENHPKREVFDEEENYLPEVLDAIYRDGVESVLSHAEDYYQTRELTLSLDYYDGRWYITPDDALLLCFAGGDSSGAMFANNAKADVLGDLTYIPKLYVIAEDVTLVPAPNQEKYGKTDDPAFIEELLASYPRVTGIDEPFWNKDIKLLEGKFNYYADDTIVFVAWRELYGGKNCTFADVYIADPSQLRRKLTEDTYGSNVHKPATELAKEANAVIALNGDFYKHRGIGITAYQRKLYRFNPYLLELCHVDSKGNMHFTYAGELKEKEDAEKYIADNDIIFSLAFGPVLVEDYTVHEAGNGYPLGQVTEHYSRSALGQRGSCHYLLMNINPGYGTGSATIEDSRNIMQSMGVERAYAMDGGQTAEIVINGKMFNPVDFLNERMVSDIIYFATALPEAENE
ncbi:MAG: phosphodiester glycosidase family protein [Lachnospiraceae bacterium]|nr:phosphodiester glycosidase family protein [Lachnospiraceae bacterium]